MVPTRTIEDYIYVFEIFFFSFGTMSIWLPEIVIDVHILFIFLLLDKFLLNMQGVHASEYTSHIPYCANPVATDECRTEHIKLHVLSVRWVVQGRKQAYIRLSLLKNKTHTSKHETYYTY